MEFIKEDLIKSPLNYTGGKFKLLTQILPLLPNEINEFVDLFAGGCNIGVNIKANRIICNDIETHVIGFMKDILKVKDSDEALKILRETINTYGISKTNEEGFKKIREDYNSGKNTWDMFYVMITNAFNYQIRFNGKGGYNMPFGRDRSSFNPTLEKNFIRFVDKLKELNIVFACNDFKKLDISKLKQDDLIYCDPPYLVTCASYNEKDGWNETHERELLSMLDRLNKNNIKFALSNVLENKGKKNEILIEWSKKYNINYLNMTYGNCNYHAKDKSENSTVEVLITNY